MIKSMTGYGKAECTIGADKYLVEIRSVNGKSADISIKTQFIPRDKEMAVRQMLAERLGRGNIDLFITLRKGVDASLSKSLDGEAFRSWTSQIREAASGAGTGGAGIHHRRTAVHPAPPPRDPARLPPVREKALPPDRNQEG